MKSARAPAELSRKILYVNHTGKVSGAEAVLLQMLGGVNRSLYEPLLLCGREGPLSTMAAELGVRCERIQEVHARFTKNPVRMFFYVASIVGAMRRIRSFIAHERPALVHANTVRSGIACSISAFGMNVPVLWHVHDILPRHPLTRAIRLLLRLSSATRAVCVSHATALALSGRHAWRSRVTVLHNGVDLHRFPAKNAVPRFTYELGALRSELGLSENDFIFCSVGQIAPRKDLLRLIRVFALVRKRATHAHLLVVGEAVFNRDHEYRDEVVDLVQRLGLQSYVHFLGRRSDVPRLMRASDAFVMLSLQEPFGLVLVEAMSSGIVVIASKVGGIPEIVTDKHTGLLVPALDDQRSAECIADVVFDVQTRTRMEENALTQVCPRFTLERFLDGLHQYYASLLDLETRSSGSEQSRDTA